MKRSALKRKTPLARGTATLKRTVLRPRPENRKRRAKIPPAVRAAVRRRSGGRCVACVAHDAHLFTRVRWGRRVEHLHHVLPVQRFPEYELAQDNMVGVCATCHMNHEAAARRIPWEALPDETIAWVHTRGGREWRYLTATYPRWGVRSGSRSSR